MKITETEFELVKRRIRDSKADVVCQQEIVTLFRNAELPMQLAERALSDFEAVQHEHEAYLSRLKGRHDGIAVPDPWQRG